MTVEQFMYLCHQRLNLTTDCGYAYALTAMGDIGFIVYNDTRLILRQLQQILILRIQCMAAVQYDDYKLCLGNCL